jgi:hypothetical protein
MTASKLHIDLSQGILDVEGADDFVLTIYNDFKDRLNFGARQAPPPTASAHSNNETETTKSPLHANGASKGRKKPRESQSIVKDLDLSKGKHGRLKDFYGKYETKTNFERNLVFVYFLQHELGISGITDNHIFTCYRDVGAKLPTALRQSLFDTSNRNGWLDTSDMSNIVVATPGMNHIEHDLPKKVAEQ